MVKFDTSSIDLIPRPVKTYHRETYDRILPTNSKFDAKGKTVLVTAGATGIGLAISKAFAEAGVRRIIIVSRRPEPQAHAKADIESEYPGTKVETVTCSVTDNANMAQIMQRAGDIDILVLCAAAPNHHGSLTEAKGENVRNTFETNVIACLELVQTYVNLPPPTSGSRTIINISSGSAHCYVPGQTVMAASKAAFAQMLSFYADEFTPEKSGIRMFNVHPGIFWTENVENSYEKEAMEWEDINLAGHFCVWLASPEADFLHGRFVWAQWDVDELISNAKERIETDPFYLKIGLMQ